MPLAIRRAVPVLLLLCLLPLAACVTMNRPPETAEERAQRKRREDQACVDFFRDTHERMFSRMVRKAGTAETFDVLVLSGGGDFGAFGAGFLVGWGECEDPAFRRPSFDFVAGTSTGAILAPLAFVGTDDAYQIGATLYSDPPKDLVQKQGLLPIWPWNVSLADPSGLRRTIEEKLSPELLDAMRERGKEGCIVSCATTNIDFGTFRPFSLVERADLPDDEYRQFVVERIMASSAIPGVFPPILIDGSLFVDGGATENAWTLRDQTRNGTAVSRFLATRAANRMPKIRVWYVVNNQLFPPGETIEPDWIDLAGRGLSTSIRSALIKDLRLAAYVAQVTDERIPGEIEFRFVAVPNDFVPPVPGNFKPETMRALVELGKRMGRDPSSWQVEVPYLDGVGGWTPYEEPLDRPR